MKQIINGEALKPFIHNALRTEFDSKGVLYASRFTEMQLGRYAYETDKLAGDLYGRAQAASSVTIDLMTDSSFIGIDFTAKIRIEETGKDVDLVVDGTLTDSYTLTSEYDKPKPMAFALPEGMHHVQIFIPWGMQMGVKDIVADETASVLPAPEKDLRILVLGDSITQGYIGRHTAVNYVGRMITGLNAEVLNQAVGGYYFEAAVLDPALKSWKPDLITVAYGTNDYGDRPTPELYEAYARGFTDALTALFPDVPVLGIMPINRMDDMFRSRRLMWDFQFEDAMNIIRKTYASYPQITVLEDDFFPHLPDYYAADKLHPSDTGFLLYGEAVVNKIRSMDIKGRK